MTYSFRNMDNGIATFEDFHRGRFSVTSIHTKDFKWSVMIEAIRGPPRYISCVIENNPYDDIFIITVLSYTFSRRKFVQIMDTLDGSFIYRRV